jgi:RNA polymerase sigma-70 factor (ECF subfamily)
VVRNLVEKRQRKPAERVRATGDDLLAAALEVEARDAAPDTAMEDAFEKAMLVVLLNLVRQEVTPQTFQAFELTARHGLSGAEVAEITGLRRDAVYAARSRVLARLQELGAPYRDEGHLTEQIKQAYDSLRNGAAEALLAARVKETMRSS